MGVPEVGVSEEGFVQGRLLVKFQDMKFKEPKFKMKFI